jgi:predicted DNA-binding transcriptional regulator YafY
LCVIFGRICLVNNLPSNYCGCTSNFDVGIEYLLRVMTMRFEKAEIIFRLAVDMQGTREGLALKDIENNFSVSRRTAERFRDSVERIFPQMEQVNPHEIPKRWRIPSGTLNNLIGFGAGELAELNNAIEILRRDNLIDQADKLAGLAGKLNAVITADQLGRIETDLEFLTQTEGLAMRPGPHPIIDPSILADLREAIISDRKVRLHYRSRSTGLLSRQIVCPYGFLYGSRHYLIGFSMNPQIRDYRQYSLADIEKVDVTGWIFDRSTEFSLEDYAAQSFGIYRDDDGPYEVEWHFHPDVRDDVHQFHFHPSQSLEDQPDGTVVVLFTADGLREMASHLFTWGSYVKVKKPKELKNYYRDMLEENRDTISDLGF